MFPNLIQYLDMTVIGKEPVLGIGGNVPNSAA